MSDKLYRWVRAIKILLFCFMIYAMAFLAIYTHYIDKMYETIRTEEFIKWQQKIENLEKWFPF